MKNLLILGLLLPLISCSSNIDLPGTTDNQNSNTVDFKSQELNKVQNRIDSLNQNLLAENQNSRGFRSWFKKIFAIVTADAVGCMFGTIYGGPVGSFVGTISSSALAAAIPVNSIEPSTSEVSRSLTPSFVKLHSITEDSLALKKVIVPKFSVNKDLLGDSIGYYHNLVIINTKKELMDNAVTIDSLLTTIKKNTISVCKYNQVDVDNAMKTNSPLFNNVLSEKMKASNFENVHDLINAWIDLYPEKAGELTTLESFLTGLSNIDIDNYNGDYLSYVLEIISNSSLDDETKNTLSQSFIVGNASYQLWDANSEE
jgi:hypothetical protein